MNLANLPLWWWFLVVITAGNTSYWVWSAWSFASHARSIRWSQVWLSGVYTAVCGFRAVFPRADVQRICLFDTWLSSVAIGRSLATIAELCFAAQWALLLREYSLATGSIPGRRISSWIVPLIFVAEIFSWYSTLTTSFFGNMCEETLWAVSALLLLIGVYCIRVRAGKQAQAFLNAVFLLGIAYVAYMALVDVPLYAGRWLQESAAGKPILSLHEGLWDVAYRWIPTRDPAVWKAEISWMLLYFSVAVWASLAIPRAPKLS